jgi:hypothetical protein
VLNRLRERGIPTRDTHGRPPLLNAADRSTHPDTTSYDPRVPRTLRRARQSEPGPPRRCRADARTPGA